MLIVSDTSPITNLLRIDQIHLLKQLFKKIIIPQKVYEELTNYENQKEELDQLSWVVVHQVKDSKMVQNLSEALDPGEAEAILLAQELNADYLIIDERKGRKVAESFGINIVGLLGVLIRAKEKGYLDKLKPILDKLINEVGFWVSPQLYRRILEKVGE